MSFKTDGYKILKDIIPVNNMYEEAIKISETIPGLRDDQAPNSPAYSNYPQSFKDFHYSFTQKMEELTGYNKLYPTYSYWRMYYNGSTLYRHTDRPACEISMTLFLGGDSWDIYLQNRKKEEICIKQNPGDAILYMGCELEHWRNEFKGQQHAQIFLHYVDQNGPNAWAKYDLRKCREENNQV
jgi:hypothetical protein